ncbi:MAG: alpha/beta hydrolase fold domain-containing protein [Acidimicrobiales bacterium]
MPYVFVGVSVLGALLVVNAYRPVRREPLSVVSFFCGWVIGELPIQAIVVEVAGTVVFGIYGAFANWAGWVGLVLAGAGWVGLVGLAVTGHRAGRVVAEALAGASGPPLPTVEAPKPEWGRWWRLTQAVPIRARSTVVTKDVDYWGDGIRRHRLDIIARKDLDRGLRAAPVMIYIHGGAWVIGDKREQGKPMLYELVARGWVCVAINYRLSPKATWPEHIVDCKRAIAWVREHIAEYGGDPSFIALSGGSAGGHLSALAALSAGDATWQPGFESADTSVDACVPFYGVMDMTGDESGAGKYGPGLRELLERRVMKVPISEDRALFEQASPTRRVHAGAPPFFVLHGRNDTLVPVEVARLFVEALRGVSEAPVVLAELPLAQHAFDVLASLRCQATTAGVVSFLDAVRSSRRAPPAPDGPPVRRAPEDARP